MKIKFINLQRVHVCTSFMILAGYKIVEHIDEQVEKKATEDQETSMCRSLFF